MSLKPLLISKSVTLVGHLLGVVDRVFGNVVVDTNLEAPFEYNEKLRAKGDILRTYNLNGWFFLNYEDVTTLLTDNTRLTSDLTQNAFMSTVLRSLAGGGPVPFLDNPSILLRDPPDHTRLRQLAIKGFTNRYVQSLRPRIAMMVDELLDAAEGEEIDIIRDLARPLPVMMIAEMLGVPASERHLFEDWSAELLLILELSDHTKVKRAVAADIAMRDYLANLVEQKRQQRGQDLLSSFIEAEEDGDKLSLEEVYSMCVALLTAGHETTTRLIGTTLYSLMQHPDQLSDAAASPDNLARAVEETLRTQPPVALVSRTAREDFEFKGHQIKQGHLLVLSITGANRDPATFENPHEFNIRTERKRHVSFGHGIHLCLGMPLARLETQVALAQLFARGDFELAGDPVWEDNPLFRGLDQLKIKRKT